MSTFGQINVVVSDMASSVEFYRLLELAVPDPAEWPAGSGAEHIDDIPTEPSSYMALDNHRMAHIWIGGLEPQRSGGNVVVGLMVKTRDDVDRLYERVRSAGHPVGQEPYDAFFGSRYAVVIDPDGNQVGLKSPVEQDRKYVPKYEVPERNVPDRPIRPVGYWLKLLDSLIETDLTNVLQAFGLTRRHWQALNVIAQLPQRVNAMAAQLSQFFDAEAAETLVSELTATDWIRQRDDETLEFSDLGHERFPNVCTAVATARSRIGKGVTEQDYNTTIATLETMSTNLGWVDNPGGT